MVHLRIRGKFIAILIIASVLPLTIALVAAQFLSYRYYRTAQGRLYETMAQYLANNLSFSVNEQVEDLDEWIVLSDLSNLLEHLRSIPAARVAAMEKQWPTLTPENPDLRSILENKLAERLRAFQRINPLFVELFITDRDGNVAASTVKTSDFLQSDERWWQRAVAMPSRTANVEGIRYDQSAAVYSIGVSLPIRKAPNSTGKPLGVIKGVLSATPLFASLKPVMSRDKAIREVVLGNGEVLFRLYGEQIMRVQRSIQKEALQEMHSKKSGWMLTSLDEKEIDLVGHAALQLIAGGTGATAPEIESIQVVVYNTAAVALAPVRKQVYLVTGFGIYLVAVFACAGYYIAGKKILDPLERLRAVVQRVGASAKLDSASEIEPVQSGRRHRWVTQLEKIRTKDELEELAREFAWMARRVLTYHQRLEQQIAEKTAETQRDLDMAREFQEALMPREYPRVPTPGCNDALELKFHHVYQAASTVGGDFFDMVKLSDHRVGVFIADVMGHGARSALVTAILRTLIQDFVHDTNDPAVFLEILNRHFHEIVRQSKEFIFVSAFYLVIDTRMEEVRFASAGHPSPLFADRERRRVTPLIEDLKNNPALGLFPSSTYEQHVKGIIPGDIFLLFTDGAYEVTNPDEKEFGLDRVRKVVAKHLSESSVEINRAIVDAINEFLGQSSPPDDICLVSVEVMAAGANRVAHRQMLAAER
jgi:sigma-B regulation protein RsbU (phosphoserine phosphatase)